MAQVLSQVAKVLSVVYSSVQKKGILMGVKAKRRHARKMILKVLESKIPELKNEIIKQINNYPFWTRVHFAWKVVLGKI